MRHPFSASFVFAAALAVLGGCVALDHYPSKGDVRPHPGVEAARQYPIQGIDISRWQGEIDWASVKAAGTRFAYIKATEGGDHIDPAFQRNWEGARRAGVPRGAYHFVYWCRPAHEQAVWFKQQIPNDPEALPPVLDVEWNGHSKTCPKKVERSLALEKIRLMLTELEQLTGKKPVIYTDITFHKDVLEGEFNDYAYWIRSTAAKPEVRYKDRPWAFWQFTTTGRVPGIKGDVDRNAFYGNEGEFTGWREGRFDIGTRTWTRERKVPPQPSPGPEHTPVATLPGAAAPVAASRFQPASLGQVADQSETEAE
ncbi:MULTISPECIES: glycoside hydrolase family 25 protein [Bosea]|jgi:lysozyme|uniref:GH25 family lysozyme n=1 Tax=Bosea rubneri TaxID=3075434 RepID=A0ABU3SD35_9HYPH|nr:MULTISPECIES: GH25 family lysozyme [unclassified Bosea (in: a-proteobacteria)]MDU0342606.1 GH25 family lysozyme [Bosea sp. ZW T0_25]HEV7334752.1 GH25 family lysozyme [Bosea sp. (in: a-proteobacteria)]